VADQLWLMTRIREEEERGFLSCVSTLTRDIDIAILSVRPSVCPSVTFQYQMKMA